MTRSTGTLEEVDNGWIVQFVLEHVARVGQPTLEPPTVFMRVYTDRDEAARAIGEWMMTVKPPSMGDEVEDMFNYDKKQARDS